MDWNSVRQDLRSELGREPTDTEIASELSSRIQCIEDMCDEIDERNKRTFLIGDEYENYRSN
jgi:DNA-directed RNA polymerase specialized sigma subunit